MRRNQTFKNCQSCGMPLARDERGGGTNEDGSKNVMYCSHCYQSGRFTLPDVTVAQMQDSVKLKLKKMGFPGLIAGLLTRKIPKLQRWNKK